MAKIHSTAVISKKAHLGKDVEVGPYSVIGDNVKIGKATKILNNVTIEGCVDIGENNKIFSGAVIGSPPQDLKYKGEESFLVIGNNNIIREYVTINTGTKGNTTKIADGNLIMAYSHIAHDCEVGNRCIFANNATLAGHVSVEDEVVIGGLSAVHQFVNIGKLAIIGGCSKVVQDVPPYSTCDGHPAKVYSINSVGLKRANIAKNTIHQLKTAFKILFHSGLSFTHAAKKLEEEFKDFSPELSHLISFVKNSKRGISR
ncbi:MAG: acyl-ACP--UDP-N-acetylglucosamine O-acyltransferase [Candidatus Omnitrophica bacterium]|nr:acyl-ACP--UDP-N-acetylglucosamine O-acyltransferase [Candidatus Omnitrophota bacterium]MDD5352860.1 acyl-ACP--UDP-N-acetylglucosamine O-acyltransferase [Candidatus Omnitrophota bacterium]MDD5550459.1 acyl-ACP--UDP-N-acetylglucosamine O-acyltransferase [Candidatus Omnitrophota bacterium]